MNNTIFNYDGHGYNVIWDWKSQTLIGMELVFDSFRNAFADNEYKKLYKSKTGCTGTIEINDPFRIATNLNIISVRTDVSLAYMLSQIETCAKDVQQTTLIVPIASHYDLQISERYPVWIITKDYLYRSIVYAIYFEYNENIAKLLKNEIKQKDFSKVHLHLSMKNKNGDDAIQDCISNIDTKLNKEDYARKCQQTLRELFPEIYLMFDITSKNTMDYPIYSNDVQPSLIAREWKWVLLKFLDPQGFENCKNWIHKDTDKYEYIYPFLNIKKQDDIYEYFYENYMNVIPFDEEELQKIYFHDNKIVYKDNVSCLSVKKDNKNNYLYILHWNVQKLDKLQKYIPEAYRDKITLDKNMDKDFYTYEIYKSYPVHYNEFELKELITELKTEFVRKFIKNIELDDIDFMSLPEDIEVSLSDSIVAGNCRPGTQRFCEKYRLDINKTYTIRELKSHENWNEMFASNQFQNVLKAAWLREHSDIKIDD